MQNTTWYNLNKPEGTDIVDVSKFNQNSDTIDQELHKAKLTADNQADAYDDTETYSVGDLVIYGNVLYKCTTAILVEESWDSTHWEQTTLAEAIATGGGTTELYYEPGDSYQYNDTVDEEGYIAIGYITSNKTKIKFDIILPKGLKQITS